MLRTTIILVLFVAPLWAAPEDSSIIVESDVMPHLKDFQRRAEQVRKGELTPAQLVEYYRVRTADSSISSKERAIRHYMYALVLQQTANGQNSNGKKARQEYQQALRVYARFPGAHVALAVLAMKDRKSGRAEEHVKQALRLEPEGIAALLMRGRILAARKEYDRALEYFKRANDVEPNGDAWTLIAGVQVEQFYKSYDEELKAKFAQEAVMAVTTWLILEPKVAQAHLMKARVHLNLGQVEQALETLEKALSQANFDDVDKLRFLRLLRSVYEVTGDVKGMENTLRRMRKNPKVTGSDRERIDERLKDIEEKGKTAFIVWQVENLIKVLENDGIDVDQRRAALDRLLEFYLDDRVLMNVHLRKLGWKVFQRSFKILVDAPPELTIRMMKFFRDRFPDPHLVRILVHFIYPYANERTTPEVRVEVIRTLAAVGGDAALPTLLYSLRDEPGAVLREVDKSLCQVTERRSPVGSDIAPLNAAQKVLARKKWLAWARSPAGGERLADSFQKLAKIVKQDPAHTRGLRTAPLVDHTVNLVLLDGDMPWTAWRAAYDFLVKYWGKDPRPPERRGKPVEPQERDSVTEALRKEWDDTAPKDPGPAAGKDEDGG